MEIVEHGTSGSHWGGGNDDLVIHHGRRQIQLTREQSYLLYIHILEYLSDESGE